MFWGPSHFVARRWSRLVALAARLRPELVFYAHQHRPHVSAARQPALVGLGSFRDGQSSAVVLDSAETGRLVRALRARQTAAQPEAGPAAIPILWSQDEPRGSPSYAAPTWMPGSDLLLVSLWGNAAQTRLLEPSNGTSRRFSKEPWLTIAVSANGARVATIDNQIVGVDHIVVTRSDGSILTQAAVPPHVPLFQGEEQELWIG